MRKVKLLALLLAALMVVAAFAGCADTTEIEGDVDGLESRVEQLENAINGVQGSVSDLENSVSGIGSGIADNNTAVQGVLDALKDLESKLNETEKAPETEAPVAGDSVDALKKRADELGAKIGALQAEVMADQVHYVAADYVDALKALTAAHTEIAASNTVAAMDAVYAALEAKLAALVRVDDKFYNYYTQLKGNYTGDEACLALVEEALDWYEEAEEHYEDVTFDWTKYETPELDKKGNPIEVDLDDLVDEIEGWEDELEDIEDRAEAFVERIDDIEPDAEYATLAGLVGEITSWKKEAVALAPVHGDLVTNYAKLEAALEASLNFKVAETLIDALKVESVLNGDSVDLFKDYTDLLATGSHVIFVAVDEDGEFILNDEEVVYTADVYENINKAIDKWIDENDITDEVAECSSKKVFAEGDETFYAKYLNAEKFVASMAAEFEAFKKGAAADILALNSKSLANSEALVAAYQANADAINEWFEATVKAYKDACAAEDKADREIKNTRVVTAAAFEGVLEDNFNEMVVLAGLGAANLEDEDDDNLYFGEELNYTAGIVGDDESTHANYNYIQFYNFAKDYEATVEFLTSTYKAAKLAADAINETVAKFPVLQQISVVEVLTAVGGYHYEDVLDEGTEYETEALLVATEDFAAGTIADYMAKYGKGGSEYDEGSKADLSSLVDMAAYNKLVAAVTARVDEIDDATAALNAAYDKLLGDFDEAIVTTANTAAVAELVAAINAWKNAGGRIDAQLAVEYKTEGDYKSYTLVDVVKAYDALSNNARFEEIVKKLEDRSTAIVTEANLLVSLYKMIDEVNKFSTISYDTLTNTATLKGNFAVTKLTKGTPDDNGNYKWGVTYVTFDAETMTFTTKTAWDLISAGKKSEATALVDYVAKLTVYSGSMDVKNTLAALAELWNGKVFSTTQLIELGTKLYAKFMADNYGETFAAVETARKNFVAANNGYELKGWIVDVANNIKAHDLGYDISSIKKVTTLAGLTTNLNAASAVLEESVTFGGYANADLTSDFALSSFKTVSDETTPDIADDTRAMTMAEIYAELGILDATEYDVDATIVWEYRAPAETEPPVEA